MMDRILMIVPTRQRNQKHLELIQSWKETNSSKTSLVFVLDEDDAENYQKQPGVTYLISPRIRMIPSLNYAASRFCHEYKYIGFMGDDHRFRTKDWDLKLLEDLKNEKTWIAYGDDLLQGATIPTAVVMSSNIIQTQGFMVPLTFIHMHADTYWKKLGEDLGILHYYPDIVIEHMHYYNGKSEEDEMYKSVNNDKMHGHDGAELHYYWDHNYKFDLEKLKKIL